MPQPKRRLITGNPYQNTIDKAMGQLASLESSIREATAKNAMVSARVQDKTRRLIVKGYQANSDSVGWHAQIGEGHNYLLKRINITADQNTAPILVLVGRQDALGVRELIPTSELVAVIFSNGSTGFTYSDAFNNDIFARAGDDIFIQVSGAATSHTIIASIEAEMAVPHSVVMTETEKLSRQVAEPAQDVADVEQTPVAVDPEEAERHTNPGTLEDMEESDLYVDGGELAQEDAKVLIPDAGAHLPPHLR